MTPPGASEARAEATHVPSRPHAWDADWSLRHVLLGLAPVVAITVALRSLPDVPGHAGLLALWAAQFCWLGLFPTIMRRRLRIPRRGGPIDYAGIGFGLLVGLGVMVVSALFLIIGDSPEANADSEAAGRVMGGINVPTAIALAVFGSTAGPWIEERFFRGFLLHALARRAPLPVAVLVQAGVFAGVHFYGVVGSLSVFVAGVIFGSVARLRGSLVLAITAHIAVNTTVFTLTAVESQREKPWIGIRAEPVSEEDGQFQVLTHVEVDSPAARAGLRVGDMLHTADGYAMPTSFRDFARWVQTRSVGDTIVLRFRRESQFYRTEVTLEERPKVDEPSREEPEPPPNPD